MGNLEQFAAVRWQSSDVTTELQGRVFRCLKCIKLNDSLKRRILQSAGGISEQRPKWRCDTAQAKSMELEAASGGRLQDRRRQSGRALADGFERVGRLMECFIDKGSADKGGRPACGWGLLWKRLALAAVPGFPFR